jgi:hypothetical protein
LLGTLAGRGEGSLGGVQRFGRTISARLGRAEVPCGAFGCATGFGGSFARGLQTLGSLALDFRV